MTFHEKNSNRISAASWKYGMFLSTSPMFGWLTSSSYSPLFCDIWSRSIKRRYEVVLLPGYRRPSRLNVRDIDAIWYEGPVEAPTVVWDSGTPKGLFEVIHECFDPHMEMKDFIKVRDTETGEFVDDPRSAEVLRRRPVHDFREDILSFEMKNARKAHFVGMKEFYGQMSDEQLLSHAHYWADIWTNVRDGADGSRRGMLDWMSKEEADEAFAWLSTLSNKDRLRDPRMRFGLSIYETEKSKKPKIFFDQMDLDYRIKTGSIKTEAEIVDFKIRRDMPITEEERKHFEESAEGKEIRRVREGGWKAFFGLK